MDLTYVELSVNRPLSEEEFEQVYGRLADKFTSVDAAKDHEGNARFLVGFVVGESENEWWGVPLDADPGDL